MLANATDPARANDTLMYSWAVYENDSNRPVALKAGVDLEKFSFTPGDNGSYNVVLTARDEDGGESTIEKSFEVLNLPPRAIITAISSIRAEGIAIEINGKATESAGQNDILTDHRSVFKGNSYLDRFRAKVKGEGTHSGQDDLVFRLGLIHTEQPGDQSADRFRIRIWNAKTGRLVYDQQPGAVDNAEPSSMLTGGSLTIAPRH